MDRGGGREEGRKEGRMEGGWVVKMEGEEECGAVVRRGMPGRWLLGGFDLHWSCPRENSKECTEARGEWGGREGGKALMDR